MKKYELTSESKLWFGRTLFRIKALVSFDGVDAGELGGFVEKEENLEQSGNAWVSGNAQVAGNAWVSGNAQVYGDARVYGNAWVSGNAQVYGDARVAGNAWVSGNAQVYGDAWVSGNARVAGDAWVLSCKHVAWFSNVGSEDGTLTAYTVKQNGIEITRGCFRGSLEEFEAAVAKHHGESDFGKQYVSLVQYIKLRFLGVTVEVEVEAATDAVPAAETAAETEADDAT